MPEHFVRVDVSHSNEPSLVHQHALHWLLRRPKNGRQALGRKVIRQRFEPKRASITRESRLIHQTDGPEPANVAVMHRAPVVQGKLDGRVPSLALRQLAGIDEKRARKARLHDEGIAGGQLDHDELRATPHPRDRRAAYTPAELRRRYLAEDVGAGDASEGDDATSDRRVEIARDRLGLR